MAGLLGGGGGGERGRRALDSELNMVPMIDLLMVTIAFLLVTAVWTHSARLEALANAGTSTVCTDCGDDRPRVLHVDARAPDKFDLSWRVGHEVIASSQVPKRAVTLRDAAGRETVRYPDLADAIGKEWRARGMHAAPTDGKRDEAVLHVRDDAVYGEMIGAMDAVYATRRLLDVAGRRQDESAFLVTLAAQ